MIVLIFSINLLKLTFQFACFIPLLFLKFKSTDLVELINLERNFFIKYIIPVSLLNILFYFLKSSLKAFWFKSLVIDFAITHHNITRIIFILLHFFSYLLFTQIERTPQFLFFQFKLNSFVLLSSFIRLRRNKKFFL